MPALRATVETGFPSSPEIRDRHLRTGGSKSTVPGEMKVLPGNALATAESPSPGTSLAKSNFFIMVSGIIVFYPFPGE
jgi:hypothetical protein